MTTWIGPILLTFRVTRRWPGAAECAAVRSWRLPSGWPGGAQPVGVGAGVDDVGVEGEPVHRRGEEGVGERGSPFAERGVGGAGDGGSFLGGGDELEDQFGATSVESDVVDFVEDQEVEVGLARYQPGQAFAVGSFTEFVRQGSGGDVSDSAALFSGKVRLLGPGGATDIATMHNQTLIVSDHEAAEIRWTS